MFKTDHIVVLSTILFMKGGLGWPQLTSSSPEIIMCAPLENTALINLQVIEIIHLSHMKLYQWTPEFP